jgi:hypothetical protein
MPEQQFLEGKAAKPAELKLRLPRAGLEYLQGAIQNPNFSESHLEAMLANPVLPAGLIQGLAAQKQYLARYEVKRAIVFHRNAPRTLKLNLLHFLGWRDLARVVEDPPQLPPVKRAAETLLKKRIEEMAVGEKIALARIAGPGVMPALCADLHPEIIAALLTNPRLTEDEVLAICAEERASAAALSTVGSNSRWSGRHAVRMALLRNAATPAKISLEFLDTLSGIDLREIIALPTTPRLVRATARQLLKSRDAIVDRKKVVS